MKYINTLDLSGGKVNIALTEEEYLDYVNGDYEYDYECDYKNYIPLSKSDFHSVKEDIYRMLVKYLDFKNLNNLYKRKGKIKYNYIAEERICHGDGDFYENVEIIITEEDYNYIANTGLEIKVPKYCMFSDHNIDIGPVFEYRDFKKIVTKEDSSIERIFNTENNIISKNSKNWYYEDYMIDDCEEELLEIDTNIFINFYKNINNCEYYNEIPAIFSDHDIKDIVFEESISEKEIREMENSFYKIREEEFFKYREVYIRNFYEIFSENGLSLLNIENSIVISNNNEEIAIPISVNHDYFISSVLPKIFSCRSKNNLYKEILRCSYVDSWVENVRMAKLEEIKNYCDANTISELNSFFKNVYNFNRSLVEGS